MGVVRALLPVLRLAAGAGLRPGPVLLGAALRRCSSPRTLLTPPQPLASRLEWSGEAVALFRAPATGRRSAGRHRGRLARSLALQGELLCAAGRYAEALAAVEESLAVPEARALRTPAVDRRLTLTFALAGVGRLDEALVVAREHADAYGDVATGPVGRSSGSRAQALRAYACVLEWAGRPAESADVFRQCVALIRELSPWRRLPVELLYTRTLVELTGVLRTLARFDEAIEAGEEARERTGVVLPRLNPEGLTLNARLLSDLAWCLGSTGEVDRARETATEAVAACRTMIVYDPAAGQPRLVIALRCLAHHLDRLEAHDEERVALCELAALCFQLAISSPDVYEPALAEALDGLALCHARDGEFSESVAAAERSVALYRRAAERDPAAHEPELARTLGALSTHLSRTDSGDGSVAAAREALEITRRSAEPDGQEHRSRIAQRLRLLGRALLRTGDEEEAEACFTEAETILRALMETGGRERYAAGLDAALSGLAAALGAAVDVHLDAGRATEAAAALDRIHRLTWRTGRSDVHAACVTAFARARAREPEGIRQAWQRATGEPWPTFVYRIG
ncbi:tetratricopeptide repeat protein [Streptomyces sp. CEV 2-1]|nr:tetratricopeptide repeat protein [Streptomyces sp. CEV 2-1]